MLRAAISVHNSKGFAVLPLNIGTSDLPVTEAATSTTDERPDLQRD